MITMVTATVNSAEVLKKKWGEEDIKKRTRHNMEERKMDFSGRWQQNTDKEVTSGTYKNYILENICIYFLWPLL